MGTKLPPLDLPFQRYTTPTERKATHRSWLWWGGVESSGDYERDCRTGYRLALTYLEYEAAGVGLRPGCLQHIVGDMPSNHSGVEIGFLTIVAKAAANGIQRGRRLVEFWDTAAAADQAGVQ